MTVISVPKAENIEEQTMLWQAYSDALAAHNIACAKSKTTTGEKVKLALDAARAWQRLADSVGATAVMPTPGLEQNEAMARLRAMTDERDTLLEAVGEAYATVSAIMKGDMLSHLPADKDAARWQNVAITLLTASERSLHAIVGDAF